MVTQWSRGQGLQASPRSPSGNLGRGSAPLLTPICSLLAAAPACLSPSFPGPCHPSIPVIINSVPCFLSQTDETLASNLRFIPRRARGRGGPLLGREPPPAEGGSALQTRIPWHLHAAASIRTPPVAHLPSSAVRLSQTDSGSRAPYVDACR